MPDLEAIKALIRAKKYGEARMLLKTLNDDAVIRAIEKKLQMLETAENEIPPPANAQTGVGDGAAE